MSETRTATMLQRVPAILAVTANSYGLSWQAGESRKPRADSERRRKERNKGEAKPNAQH